MNLHPSKLLSLSLGLALLGLPTTAPAADLYGPPVGPGPNPAAPPTPTPTSPTTPATPGPGPSAPVSPPAVSTTDEHAGDEEMRDSVSLEEVFDLLKRRSPRYAAYQADIDVAKSDVAAARVLPNPVVNLAILYLNSGFNQNGVGTYYANVSLPLLIAGQRRMRVKAARSGVKAAEAGLKATYHELAHEARELYVELQADQARIAVLDAALADIARLQEVITARRRSGAETDYDILRIDVEAAAWRARRVEEEAEAQDTAGRLGVVLGIPTWYPQAEGELALLGIHGNADRMWAEVERSSPAITAATRNEAFAAKQIDLARRERWPVPTVTAGTVVIQNYYSVSTTVGITVPIPVFDWGQGLMAQAKARSTRAKREKEAVVASTQAELKRALRSLSHHKHALEAFDREIAARLPALKQMAEDSFLVGNAELIELLDATRTRFEIQLTRVDLLEATAHAEVDVLAATGRIEDTKAR